MSLDPRYLVGFGFALECLILSEILDCGFSCFFGFEFDVFGGALEFLLLMEFKEADAFVDEVASLNHVLKHLRIFSATMVLPAGDGGGLKEVKVGEALSLVHKETKHLFSIIQPSFDCASLAIVTCHRDVGCGWMYEMYDFAKVWIGVDWETPVDSKMYLRNGPISGSAGRCFSS